MQEENAKRARFDGSISKASSSFLIRVIGAVTIVSANSASPVWV